MFWKIVKSGLALFLLTTQNSYALMGSEIPCPSSNIIQQFAYKIDHASKFGESYVAATSAPVLYESKKHWIIVAFVNAESSKLAVDQGKKAVESVKYSDQKYATDPGNGQLSCVYEPRKLGEVYTMVVNK